jgi:ATP-dependent exoDNAse (exonuclease V) alpha subunit
MNHNHCLIHGLAGTGKSTLINEIAKRMGERCLRLAPTGLAAYNINGTTLDSLCVCYQNAKNSTLERVGTLYDSIIIDEISMCLHFKLNMVFEMLETLRNRGKHIQLILIGDPFQLPPVTTKNMIQAFSAKRNMPLCQDDFYFFKSKYFQEYFDNMDRFLLARNYRQNEPVLGETLGRIATGTADKYDIDYINQQVVSTPPILPIDDVPIITPFRKGVQYFNQIGLDQLGKKYVHNTFFEKLLPGYTDIEMDCRDITEPLIYSVNAPVVFTQNDTSCFWVNGTQGTINARRERDFPAGIETLEIRTDSGIDVQCIPARRMLYRFVHDSNTGQINNECVAVIRRLPVILGFALTVHRCQGMTLDKMTFNPGAGCFAPGQLYVALSRIKNLNDLRLHIPVSFDDIIVSGAAQVYFENFRQKCILIQ